MLEYTKILGQKAEKFNEEGEYMVTVQVVAPYKQLYEPYRECINRLSSDRKNINFKLTYISGTKDSRIRECRGDVIVVRGITGIAFRERAPEAHLVDIEITGYDIFNSIVECKRRYCASKIGIIGTDSVLCDMDSLRKISDAELFLFRVSNEVDIKCVLEQGRRMGIEAFIGGTTATTMCGETGQNCVPILTGKEAIENSIRLAIDAAESIDKERSRTTIMKKVLDSTRDGIIALDKNGNIEEINKRAREILGVSSDADMDRLDINAIFPKGECREAIQKHRECDSLSVINDIQYLVAFAPLITKGEYNGMLVTIQNIQYIKDKEVKVRASLKQRGLDAKYHFDDILGESASIKRSIQMAKKYSLVDSSVLISGESGTGKELFAHSIHNASRRSKEPFVAINCAAVPENLLESELFGYSEGAFSGAARGGKIGLFEMAHKGTIFLDEIGEMPINLQAKLLRVLEAKEIRRVGDNKIIPIDVRVISATNINIRQKIVEGKFRSDLLYRLNVLDIYLSPLRERVEDIPILAQTFINKFSVKTEKEFMHIDEDVFELLKQQQWEGNIRELRNICERLVVLSEDGSITCRDVLFSPWTQNMENGLAQINKPKKKKITKEEEADALGISRTTLWRRTREKNTRESETNETK